jgi:chromosome segregation protein
MAPLATVFDDREFPCSIAACDAGLPRPLPRDAATIANSSGRHNRYGQDAFMKFSKLRLIGFKSFVEPTEFHIESGLTGIVGPNGCGKSNLVEAMRWVMGENSYKNMRASGMDDVIFSGSGDRPARNTAEVGLILDNADRTAPAAFNETEVIEVSRRIERESGSTFKVNGREVRARDVQLLFADASTGARSPAMVRQGQIGEIISARPQARRRILEEAAGIAGLHSRRHEAELRLKGAEENVARLEDVLKQIDGQVDNLKRQARQATRYKGLAADIRRSQALLLHLSHRDAQQVVAEAERKLEADTRAVAERTRVQAEAARLQAIAAHALPALREQEATASAALQCLVLAREALEVEERRAKERASELERRIAHLTKDLDRERSLIEDALSVLSRLASEEEVLAVEESARADSVAQAKSRLVAGEERLAAAEVELAEAQRQFADISARRSGLERGLHEEALRSARLVTEHKKVLEELTALKSGIASEGQIAEFVEALEMARGAHQGAETEAIAAEAQHAQARHLERAALEPFNEAERKAQRIETEIRTLEKLLNTQSGDLWPPVVDHIEVAKGYEAALGAALGDDLDASINSSAPAHWSLLGSPANDPALPLGIASLAKLVNAPPALARRLAQIGVVLRTEGAQLQSRLKPGQRLVSKEGDLWRWDGFVAAAEAPTPAARRLVEKNRLGDLKRDWEVAAQEANQRKRSVEQATIALRSAADREQQMREKVRASAKAVDFAREAVAAAERTRAQMAQKTAAFEEREMRLRVGIEEAEQKKTEGREALETLPPAPALSETLDVARARASQERIAVAEARAAVQTLTHEAEVRQQRRQAIASETASWVERQCKARDQILEFENRLAAAIDEQKVFDEAPALFLQQRRALMNEIEAAEAARRNASDARARGETALSDADLQARSAFESLAAIREERAGSEARVEAARQKHHEIHRAIAQDLNCEPTELLTLAEVKPNDPLPAAAAVERRVESLRAEREKLGAVNLRADDELSEIERQKAQLVAERDDLTEAIRKLRLAVQNLNKEGRERLIAAFDIVNGHFKELFTTLFGGGSAELQLVESDDPLEAGLEIMARPPGKKPQTMTLLSGGEQALTALSLIFAVFLTNPAPICVLDEVDAPLDDANVERFCDLLDAMVKRSDTRFVTITHNPITMARMDRLFGVTMAERGVSQLVSVDLQNAANFRQAG